MSARPSGSTRWAFRYYATIGYSFSSLPAVWKLISKGYSLSRLGRFLMPGPVARAAVFEVWNKENGETQFYTFSGGGVGSGFTRVAANLQPTWITFTTEKPYTHADFQGGARIGNLSIGVGVTRSLLGFITFNNIDIKQAWWKGDEISLVGWNAEPGPDVSWAIGGVHAVGEPSKVDSKTATDEPEMVFEPLVVHLSDAAKPATKATDEPFAFAPDVVHLSDGVKPATKATDEPGMVIEPPVVPLSDAAWAGTEATDEPGMVFAPDVVHLSDAAKAEPKATDEPDIVFEPDVVHLSGADREESAGPASTDAAPRSQDEPAGVEPQPEGAAGHQGRDTGPPADDSAVSPTHGGPPAE